MKELDCGGCTACCEWGDDTAIRPVLSQYEQSVLRHTIVKGVARLEANEHGNCVYLGNKGCTIYDHRPDQCKFFDCRHLYNNMKDKTFIRVILRGSSLVRQGR